VAEDRKYCAEGICEKGHVYSFPLSAATDAVAYTRDGIVTFRKLESLAGLQQ